VSPLFQSPWSLDIYRPRGRARTKGTESQWRQPWEEGSCAWGAVGLAGKVERPGRPRSQFPSPCLSRGRTLKAKPWAGGGWVSRSGAGWSSPIPGSPAVPAKLPLMPAARGWCRQDAGAPRHAKIVFSRNRSRLGELASSLVGANGRVLPLRDRQVHPAPVDPPIVSRCFQHGLLQRGKAERAKPLKAMSRPNDLLVRGVDRPLRRAIEIERNFMPLAFGRFKGVGDGGCRARKDLDVLGEQR